MNKTKVTICTGEKCYVKATAHMKQLNNAMSAKLKSQIEFVGSSCPGHCAAAGFCSAPHVKVNDQLISGATATQVIAAIHECEHPALVA